jgi:hypothetical protein
MDWRTGSGDGRDLCRRGCLCQRCRTTRAVEARYPGAIEWKPSYERGAIMQASLAIVSGVLGIIAFLYTYDWRWLVGAALILAPWPYTKFIIMPTNRVLKSTPPEQATDQTRGLIIQWGRLHWGRTALGLLAVVAYLWALN